jgi:predicted DNA binding CopG/RHH family protein
VNCYCERMPAQRSYLPRLKYDLLDLQKERLERGLFMRIGEIFRYAADGDATNKIVDGYPNFFFYTASPDCSRIMLPKGINTVGVVVGPDRARTPVIVLSSSPHKVGGTQTPWQDFFNPDEGYVRYFGDAKNPGIDPATTLGNAAMLKASRAHDVMNRSLRRFSPPIVLFRTAKVGHSVTGYRQFQGFGIIERTTLIAQYDTKRARSFPNFAYDIAIFDISEEHEEFDWHWISDRRNRALKIKETEQYAPKKWKEWVRDGREALVRVKRRVSKLLTTPVSDQRAQTGSREHHAIQTIYEFYGKGRKHRFELLAARIAGRILQREGGHFIMGWITPPSADGGADFVGRLDLGSGFSKIKQVVFGQAKCEAPSSNTDGQHVARTVARLQRGWIGAYVTLGAFSGPVQREIIDDKYPLLLIPGATVAREVIAAASESAHGDLNEYLSAVDAEYEKCVSNRRPEEILRE